MGKMLGEILRTCSDFRSFQEVLNQVVDFYLKLEGFDRDMILENKVSKRFSEGY